MLVVITVGCGGKRKRSTFNAQRSTAGSAGVVVMAGQKGSKNDEWRNLERPMVLSAAGLNLASIDFGEDKVQFFGFLP